MSSTFKSVGCLVLFALPFAAGGLVVGGLAATQLWTWVDARSWIERPARILEAELERHTGDDSTTYRARATYEYSLDGVTYRSERVGIAGGADNIGSFQRDAYRELRSYRESGRDFRCFVDPDDPSRAVLYRRMRWGLLGLEAVFSLAFSLVGFGLIGAAMWSKEHAGAEERLRQAHPDEPWMWQEDWRDGRIRARPRAQLLGVGVFALLWNLISSPVAFLVPAEVSGGNHLALIALLFPVVGIGVASWWAVLFLRWRKFGHSTFEMARLPGIVGGPLEGRIHTRVQAPPETGFELTLSCVRRVTTGSGDDRSTREKVEWQDRRVVPPEQVGVGPGGVWVPVRFGIPWEQPPTDPEESDDRVLWRLEIEADVPGVDYAASFEIPVFRTAESDEGFVAEEPGGREGLAPAARALDPASGRQATLVRRGITLEELPSGGRRFTFQAARQRGTALAATFFLVLWSGATWLTWHLEAPLLFPLVFGLFELLLIYGVLHLWLSVRRVQVTPGTLAWQGGLLGLGRRHVLRADRVAEIGPDRGLQVGNRLLYRIEVRDREGRERVLASQIDDLSLARRLAEAMKRRLADAPGRSAIVREPDAGA